MTRMPRLYLLSQSYCHMVTKAGLSNSVDNFKFCGKVLLFYPDHCLTIMLSSSHFLFRAFVQKAENLKKALYVYDYLLSEHGVNLQGHIIELQEVANGIDKVNKGVKIAGITGGAAGAVGVAAAVGGVILAPVTAGVSLAVAAVGVGVAAAGGITGASAAITNKVHTNMDRKKVETILKDHSTQIEEIEKCVKVIGSNVEYLKKYNLSTMRGVDWQAVKVARMAHNLGDSVGAMGALSKSSGLIQGFTLGLDMYFNKEDSRQLKKGSETKFAKKIREIAKQMQATLDELMKLKSVVESDI
ncbi:apolipoprotein L3-like [Clarias gariepinus]|uniref:apolipoprotein L3-like n=1 Tax=Clarias gariepinus TaxID=13013 RepID=UPI00234CEBAD|nr:apolipoprotein L3-like [Clarias gariepinus]